MKLINFDENEILFLLTKTTDLVKSAKEIYFKTATPSDDGYSLYDYDKCQDLFYKKMMGRSSREVHAYFSTPGPSRNKCVSWYDYQGKPSYGSIPGPLGYSNYIPDCITDVILNTTLPADQKLSLLQVMMTDLLKLEANFEHRKALFNL